ncbi:MAG: 4-hydroxy-tetrahydrodipicolinate reductase [Flavobacteriia bacterium]|nr:4-hydroxy-tetrahydrodipicolinate reductase [Flavobacteriia bacterium]
MNIALIGYGKMGKTIERIALQRGHKITAIYASKNPFLLEDSARADVAIEFTAPDFVVNHISKALSINLPIVVGTTGWNHRLDEVDTWVKASGGSLLYASNFSLGVHVFEKLCAQLAGLLKGHDYLFRMDETHHVQKLDTPSGTAITLAETILAHHDGIQNWASNEGDGRTTLPIFSHRVPEVPGTHSVIAQSSIDSITLTHEANSRDGFALGSIIAAEFLVGKSGLYTMNDVLNFKS